MSTLLQYAPFKPGGKRKLADRARDLGLEQIAKQVLSCGKKSCLSEAVDTSIPGYFVLEYFLQIIPTAKASF